MRRNTLILATTMALNWAVIVLVASLTTPTVGVLFGLPDLAGLVFGVGLLGYAAGGLLTGRAMDAWGRRVGLQIALMVGVAGTLVLFVAVDGRSLPLTVAGLVVVGMGTGGANLARAAGADMHPAIRRPRGIAQILVGAAVGAVASPFVFGPLLAGARAGDASALALPWLVAAALLAIAALVLFAIRVDPRDVAEQLRAPQSGQERAVVAPARTTLELLRQPLVPLALLAALVAQAVMTAVMALAGLVLVQHGHDTSAVVMTISIHFVGMFGLVLVIGRLVERIGRFRSVVTGLIVLASGTLFLLPAVELLNFIPGMFAVGVGWNIAFVASTAILADAARSNERARLLGASDAVAISAAAALSLLAGLVVGAVGLPGMVAVGVALALIPAALFVLNRRRLEGAGAT